MDAARLQEARGTRTGWLVGVQIDEEGFACPGVISDYREAGGLGRETSGRCQHAGAGVQTLPIIPNLPIGPAIPEGTEASTS